MVDLVTCKNEEDPIKIEERLFLAVPRGCLQFVIVVFPDHTHLLFLMVLEWSQI